VLAGAAVTVGGLAGVLAELVLGHRKNLNEIISLYE
jgi:hypothetical protein